MIGTTMLNEEIKHARVGDGKSQSQGVYTRRGNANMALDPAYGNEGCNSKGNSFSNWPLVVKNLEKTKL